MVERSQKNSSSASAGTQIYFPPFPQSNHKLTTFLLLSFLLTIQMIALVRTRPLIGSTLPLSTRPSPLKLLNGHTVIPHLPRRHWIFLANQLLRHQTSHRRRPARILGQTFPPLSLHSIPTRRMFHRKISRAIHTLLQMQYRHQYVLLSTSIHISLT